MITSFYFITPKGKTLEETIRYRLNIKIRGCKRKMRNFRAASLERQQVEQDLFDRKLKAFKDK